MKVIKGLSVALVLLALTIPAYGVGKDAAVAKGSRLYVSNAGNNTISVIDLTKKEVSATIRTGVWPAGMAMDSGTGKLYVVNSNDGDSTVSVIDTASNSELKKIKVGIGPMAIALDTASGTGFSADAEHIVDGKNLSNTLSVIDLKTDTVTGKIETGTGPFDLKIFDGKIFASNSGDWTVAVVDVKSHKVLEKIKVVDTPLGVGVDQNKKKVYVAIHGKGKVSVIDASAFKEIKNIDIGKSAWYVAVDSASSRAYVTRREDNAVAVIDTNKDEDR